MKKQNLLSLIACTFFIYLAFACTVHKKLWCDSMDANVKADEETENFILFNDGNKIAGEKIAFKSGTLTKDVIMIDKDKYPIAETRGFKSNGIFFGRYKNTYAKRIIKGKINIYYREIIKHGTSTNASGQTRSTINVDCLFYYQVGDTGIIEEFYKYKTIRQLIQSCPAAAAMMDKPDKEIRKMVKANAKFLNSVFETYNACK
ncbi:MAG TPA: hypothetical protein PKC39_12550 [Ferruginibacter sp.]|nr:hypothetical protein [Ferruginibacter sp.]HMP21781.1 hypothetical protein [Ferruginibacter sp.]